MKFFFYDLYFSCRILFPRVNSKFIQIFKKKLTKFTVATATFSIGSLASAKSSGSWSNFLRPIAKNEILLSIFAPHFYPWATKNWSVAFLKDPNTNTYERFWLSVKNEWSRDRSMARIYWCGRKIPGQQNGQRLLIYVKKCWSVYGT